MERGCLDHLSLRHDKWLVIVMHVCSDIDI